MRNKTATDAPANRRIAPVGSAKRGPLLIGAEYRTSGSIHKELDTATLGALLAYSTQIMTAHVARSGNIMGSYPATKQQLREGRS